MEGRSEQDFYNDALARKVTRCLVIFQGSTLLVGLILTLLGHAPAALFIAYISFVLLLGAFLWFYIRYRSKPVVQEKRQLDQLADRLPEQIRAHAMDLHSMDQEREKLEWRQEAEMLAALLAYQGKSTDEGMAEAHLEEAYFPEIGEEIKQRLVADGFTSAGTIDRYAITRLEYLGKAQVQALLTWREGLYHIFNARRPTRLPLKIQNEIKKKYEMLCDNNSAEQQRLRGEKQELEDAWEKTARG